MALRTLHIELDLGYIKEKLMEEGWCAPVRCKDCKHRPIKPDNYNSITMDGFVLEFPDDECPCQCNDGWYSWYPPDDFFCARGKQKGEDK